MTTVGRTIPLLCLLFLCAPASLAQDDALQRNPQALAERYLGYQGDLLIPPLTPQYQVGDEAQFWVGKAGSDTPARVNATLAAVTRDVYLWIEDGVTPSGNLTQTALQLNAVMFTFLQHDNYRQPVSAPGIGSLTDQTDLLPIPDVDNDPHLYILYASDLNEDRSAVVNPIDSLPVEFAPYSNQHEMLYVNTSPYSGIPLDDPLYLTMLARGIYHWIMSYNAPGQAAWLTEIAAWILLYSVQQLQFTADDLTPFLQAPDTPLIQPPTLTSQTQTLAEQQLFAAYLIQRYGRQTYLDLFLQAGSGITPIDAVLAKNNISDPVSGAPVTGRDAFADFVMANALNLAFGDGRYYHDAIQLPQGQVVASTALTSSAELTGQSVNQFGTQYYRYTPTQAETATIRFDGGAQIARLSMPADRDPADRFYWAASAPDQNPALTRSVDLREVDGATLTFDAWYDLAPGWDYTYVSASTDGGATWKALPATTSSPNNRYGVAYGAGFTGVSNPAAPHPFPIMGVVIGGDGVTASDVAAGGPAALAGIRPGDVIIGYDNHEWEGAPNVLGLLAEYSPGDTLNLYIQRGSDRLDIPLVLGAHPTRVVEPAPLWQAQTVDLSAYAGQEIMLRFELVTLPGQADKGVAIDNIAIPEIDFHDDAEGDAAGWTLNGWQQVDNQLRQRWIVQAGTSGSASSFPSVRALITPDDADATGEWRIALQANETLTLAVSGANDDTTERPTFSLGFKSGSTS
ncbi:MAG: immune inhibitor A [Anaerolineae bacterium]